MVYVLTEIFTDDPIEVTHSPGARPGDERIRVKISGTAIRMTIGEAVELVDGIVTALVEIDAATPKPLHRNEAQVRSDVERREALE